MTLLPTEPIGSVPRSAGLLDAMAAAARGTVTTEALSAAFEEAVRDTVARFEETGSPVITDGEQRKSSFVTYPLDGATNLAAAGAVIPFVDGHTRQLPSLASGPFRYQKFAADFLLAAKPHAHRPMKQAVISASALSLLYPASGIDAYPRDVFLEDLVREAQSDIRRCLDAGAHVVQIDMTEARLSLKLDPSKALLEAFVDLNNRVLEVFSAEERARIGVHTCPGGDRDSTHSADVDYADVLPTLLRMNVGRVYVQMASEREPERVLGILAANARPDTMIFVGVVDPIDPKIETPDVVKARLLVAAKHLDPARLGSTDDCGFSPFADDASTSREIAFAKIRARVEGTELASRVLRV